MCSRTLWPSNAISMRIRARTGRAFVTTGLEDSRCSSGRLRQISRFAAIKAGSCSLLSKSNPSFDFYAPQPTPLYPRLLIVPLNKGIPFTHPATWLLFFPLASPFRASLFFSETFPFHPLLSVASLCFTVSFPPFQWIFLGPVPYFSSLPILLVLFLPLLSTNPPPLLFFCLRFPLITFISHFGPRWFFPHGPPMSFFLFSLPPIAMDTNSLYPTFLFLLFAWLSSLVPTLFPYWSTVIFFFP